MLGVPGDALADRLDDARMCRRRRLQTHLHDREHQRRSAQRDGLRANHRRHDAPEITAARLVGEVAAKLTGPVDQLGAQLGELRFGREMRQGDVQPLVDAIEHRYETGERCLDLVHVLFETAEPVLGAGLAHVAKPRCACGGGLG